jgi:hypothetical protein
VTPGKKQKKYAATPPPSPAPFQSTRSVNKCRILMKACFHDQTWLAPHNALWLRICGIQTTPPNAAAAAPKARN